MDLYNDFGQEKPIQYSNLIDNRFETETASAIIMNIYTILEKEVSNVIIRLQSENYGYACKHGNTVYEIIMDQIGKVLLTNKSELMRMYYVIKSEVRFYFSKFIMSDSVNNDVSELIDFRNNNSFEDMKKALKQNKFDFESMGLKLGEQKITNTL